MSLSAFFGGHRGRKVEPSIAETRRGAVLIKSVYDWVCEDPENRLLWVCMAAVIGTHVGLVQPDIERTEAHWRLMMTEYKPPEEAEV